MPSGVRPRGRSGRDLGDRCQRAPPSRARRAPCCRSAAMSLNAPVSSPISSCECTGIAGNVPSACASAAVARVSARSGRTMRSASRAATKRPPSAMRGQRQHAGGGSCGTPASAPWSAVGPPGPTTRVHQTRGSRARPIHRRSARLRSCGLRRRRAAIPRRGSRSRPGNAATVATSLRSACRARRARGSRRRGPSGRGSGATPRTTHSAELQSYVATAPPRPWPCPRGRGSGWRARGRAGRSAENARDRRSRGRRRRAR